MNDDASRARAPLTGGANGPEQNRRQDQIHVGARRDDDRVVAPELENGPSQTLSDNLGNVVADLERRLEADVLALKPTVVSILIGINDTWRRYDSNTTSDIPAFEDSYRRILSTLRQELSARLVICEPFLLPIPKDRIPWREDLDPRIASVRRLAMDFGATYVPLDGIFAAAACQREMNYWAPDGVHPTPAGHGLIAEAWLEAVGC